MALASAKPYSLSSPGQAAVLMHPAAHIGILAQHLDHRATVVMGQQRAATTLGRSALHPMQAAARHRSEAGRDAAGGHGLGGQR